MTTIRSRALAATATAALVAWATVATADTLTCGQSIGPGATIVVDGDIGPCTGTGTPALTVTGPLTLDMAGHQIRCPLMNFADGIHVLGEHVRIINGSVRNCGYGVRVDGGGKHSLTGVSVNANNGFGIEVLSQRATLSHCSATSNTGAGIRVATAKNRLDHCVTNNNSVGIQIEGDSNKLADSEGIANTTVGIQVSGDGNQISHNTVAANDQSGFDVSGDENKLKENHATRNTQKGFDVSGDRNSLSDNTASRNASHGFALNATSGTRFDRNLSISNAGQGLDITGDTNQVSRSHFVNSGLSGVNFTGGGTGNTFDENVAMENASADLRDTTACMSATWTDNSFSTSNDPCIQ